MSKIFLSKRYKYDGKSAKNLSKIQKIAKLNVISAFMKGILKWENNNCRCSFKRDLLISTKDYIGFNVRFVLCLNCGLIRENPRISKDTIEIFYKKYYRNLRNLKSSNSNDFFLQTYNKEKERGKTIFKYIKKHTSLKTGVVFDFGTGTGGVLKIFKDAGFETFGVDVNDDFVKFGISKGLNLKRGSIEELEEYPKRANLIIASHIIEHLHDLDRYLMELRECLEKNGFLIVLLPGLMNVQYHEENLLSFFFIEHFYYFTLQTLNKILINNGFHLIIGNEEIIALFQKTIQKFNFNISKDLIDNILIYLRIVDIPFPINGIRLLKKIKKIKYVIILNLISVLYKTKVINILVVLKDFFKEKLQLISEFINIMFKIINI